MLSQGKRRFQLGERVPFSLTKRQFWGQLTHTSVSSRNGRVVATKKIKKKKRRRRNETTRLHTADHGRRRCVFGEIAGAEGEPHRGWQRCHIGGTIVQTGRKVCRLKEQKKQERKKEKEKNETNSKHKIPIRLRARRRPPPPVSIFRRFLVLFLSQSRSQGEKETKREVASWRVWEQARCADAWRLATEKKNTYINITIFNYTDICINLCINN